MNPSKILVIQTAFIGDVLLTAPLLTALHELYPEAPIHLLTTPEGGAAYAFHPAVQSTLLYDKKGEDRSLRSLFALGKRLREESYDLLLCPHRSFRSGLLAQLSRSSVRIGYRNSAAGWFMNKTVARDMSLHEVRRLADLLRPLGIDPDDAPRRTPFTVIPQAAHAAFRLLESVGVGRSSYVVVAPGSVWGTKRWTPEGFAGLLEIFEARKQPYVLAGSKADFEVERKIAEVLGREPVSLVGQTDLLTLNAIIDSAAALVTNDSAPLHFASMNNTPTLAIFGSTVPSFGFGPLADRSAILEVDLPCRPCGIHGHPECPKKHFRCMGEITAQQVIDSLDEAISLTTPKEVSCG